MKFSLQEKFILLEDDSNSINGFSKNTDWADEIKKANNNRAQLKKIIDSFIQFEFTKEKYDFVINLGNGFIESLLKIGFKADSNPFIGFIHWLIKKNIQIDFKKYNAIHNAYVNGYIDEENLKINNTRDNLVYIEELYSKPEADILEYLQLANAFYNNHSEDVTFADTFFNSNNKLLPLSEVKANIEKAKVKLKKKPSNDMDGIVKKFVSKIELDLFIWKTLGKIYDDDPDKINKAGEEINRVINNYNKSNKDQINYNYTNPAEDPAKYKDAMAIFGKYIKDKELVGYEWDLKLLASLAAACGKKFRS